MRAVSACLLFLVAAATLASAQKCDNAPSSDPFNPTGFTNCALIQKCQTTLCACTGSTAAFPGCLAANTGSCSATQSCFANYITCLLGITAARTNTSDVACSTYGSGLYIAQLAAATAPQLNATTLAMSCGYNLCRWGNVTGNVGSCDGKAIVGVVCGAGTLLGNVPTTGVSGGTTPAPAYDIVVSIRLSGGNWSLVLNDPVKKAQLIVSLQNDIAALLGVDPKFIVIQNLVAGSLTVTFAVLQGSGKSPASLQSTVNNAASTNWLTSTSAVYATVGTDALTTLSVSVVQTGAPTTLAPGQTLPQTPAPTSSAVSAAGVWAVAAVAAVAALWA